MQSYLRVIALALGLAFALGLSLFAFGAGTRYQLVKVGEQTTLVLELAETDAQQKRGLRGRSSLGENEGMLVRLEQPKALVYSTKYTNFPIDVLYLGINGDIVQLDHMQANDERLTASSSKDPVYGAMLLLGGTASRLRLNVGSVIEFGRAPRRNPDYN